MANMKSIAAGFACYLADELSFDHQDNETIRYGLEIILGSLIEAIVIVSISYALGILPYALAIFGTSIGLRMLSGGAHFSTYGRCLTFSVIVAVALSYAAILISPLFNTVEIQLGVIGLAIAGLYFVNRWAPADHPNRPIRRQDKREMYRKLSRLYVFGWTAIVILILALWSTPLARAVCLASVGSFALQNLSITPMSYRLASSAERIFDELQMKGR